MKTGRCGYLPGERKMDWLEPISGGGVYVLEVVSGDAVIGNYVGHSVKLEARRRQHFVRLASGKHECKAMQKVFDENICSLRFKVLESDIGVIAFPYIARETWWIEHLKPTFNKVIPKPATGSFVPSWVPSKDEYKEPDDSWESPYVAALQEPDLSDKDIYGPWPYDDFEPEALYQGTYIYE